MIVPQKYIDITVQEIASLFYYIPAKTLWPPKVYRLQFRDNINLSLDLQWLTTCLNVKEEFEKWLKNNQYVNNGG